MLSNFHLLRSSRPAVSVYADGRELLVSGVFLTSGTRQKTSFLTRIGARLAAGADFLFYRVLQ